MEPRKKLSDILHDRKQFLSAWQSTRPAAETGILPPGWYIANVEKGELFAARTGTPGYKLTFSARDPVAFAGRLFWQDYWLTDAALARAMRDLSKIGITHPDQLDLPLPPGIVVRVRLAIRKRDNGDEYNEVRELHLYDLDSPPGGPAETPTPAPAGPSAPSAPPVSATAEPAPWSVDLSTLDESAAPPPKGDEATTFSFGANAEGGAE